MTKLTTSAVCPVPGGRWLLVESGDGSVTAYDLDASSLNGKLLLLPGNRLLVFTSQDFAIYNVVLVDAGKELLPETARYAFVQPLWRLYCPDNATPLGGISAPASDATATHFTFVMDDTVHDLVIPHGIHQQPRTFESVAYLPRTDLDSLPAEIGLGFEKMFARYFNGEIVRLGWARDERGRIGSVDSVYSVEAGKYHTAWRGVWLPATLDEGSGRIVQFLEDAGILIIDTALCFTL